MAFKSSFADKVRTAHPNSIAARLPVEGKRALIQWMNQQERDSQEKERQLRALDYKRGTRGRRNA